MERYIIGLAIRYQSNQAFYLLYMKYSFTNSFENTTITEAQTESGYWIT